MHDRGKKTLKPSEYIQQAELKRKKVEETYRKIGFCVVVILATAFFLLLTWLALR